MSETYVTYMVWDGCKAPANLEYNGRLIGQIARESAIDRDALLALEGDMFEDATGLALISQLENNEELQDLQSTMAKALMDYARRIRKALSVPDKRTTDATTC